MFDKVEFLAGSLRVTEGSSLITVEPAEAELGVTKELSLVNAEVVSFPFWNSLGFLSLQSLSGEHKVLILFEEDFLELPSSEVGGGKSEVVSIPFWNSSGFSSLQSLFGEHEILILFEGDDLELLSSVVGGGTSGLMSIVFNTLSSTVGTVYVIPACLRTCARSLSTSAKVSVHNWLPSSNSTSLSGRQEIIEQISRHSKTGL